jgi:dUTPase
MHGLVFPRSSISKYHLSLCNSVAVIDSSYRGEIKLRFRRLKEMGNFYQKGDKIGQLIFFSPCVPELIFVDKFENKTTLRGEKGFGSTGR